MIFNSISGGGSGTLLTTTFTGTNSGGTSFTTVARAKAFIICLTAASSMPASYVSGTGVITSVEYLGGSNPTKYAIKLSSNTYKILTDSNATVAITDTTVSFGGAGGLFASGATYTVYYLV